MLKINNMNYTGSAESVEDEKILATMNFNADMFSNYNFNLNFTKAEDIVSKVAEADFSEFKDKVFRIVLDGPTEDEEVEE